jgi:hypothetical protein
MTPPQRLSDYKKDMAVSVYVPETDRFESGVVVAFQPGTSVADLGTVVVRLDADGRELRATHPRFLRLRQ